VEALLADDIAAVATQPAAYYLPDLAGLGIGAKRQAAPVAPAAEQRNANPAEPEHGSILVAEPAAGPGVIRFPSLKLAQATGSAEGQFRTTEAGVAPPKSAVPDSRAARFEPLSTISIVPPVTGADQPGAAFRKGNWFRWNISASAFHGAAAKL